MLVASGSVATVSHGPPRTTTSIEEQGGMRRKPTKSLKQSPDQQLRTWGLERAEVAAVRRRGRGRARAVDRCHRGVQVRHGLPHDRTSAPGSGDETSIRPRCQGVSQKIFPLPLKRTRGGCRFRYISVRCSAGYRRKGKPSATRGRKVTGLPELAPFSAPGVTKGRGWIANWSCDSWRLGHHGDPRNLDMLCQRIAITCL